MAFNSRRFLNRLKEHIETNDHDTLEGEFKEKYPKVVHHYHHHDSWWPSYYRSSFYDWWWWPTYHQPIYRTTNHYYGSGSRRKQEEDDEKNKRGVIPMTIVLGITAGTFYYFYNKYLDYQEEVKLTEELELYQKRYPVLYSMSKKYLSRRATYYFYSFISQTTLAGSGIALLSNWFFWNNQIISDFAFGFGFIALIIKIIHYSNYQRTHRQANEIHQHILEILKAM